MNYTIEYADDGTRYIENQAIKGSIKIDASVHGVVVRNCNMIGPFDGAAIEITGAKANPILAFINHQFSGTAHFAAWYRGLSKVFGWLGLGHGQDVIVRDNVIFNK